MGVLVSLASAWTHACRRSHRLSRIRSGIGGEFTSRCSPTTRRMKPRSTWVRAAPWTSVGPLNSEGRETVEAVVGVDR